MDIVGKRIDIYENGYWAGTGQINNQGFIVFTDWPPILGDSDEESAKVYEAIEAAMASEDAILVNSTGGPIRVGAFEYEWTITTHIDDE